MAFLRIHCAFCGGVWEVYHKQRELDQARSCPHCDARIDGATWREQVLPAYNTMRGANGALLDDHVSYHCPRFEVDYINDGTFQNANPQAVAVDDLREITSDLRDEIGELRVDFARLGAELRKKGSENK